MGALDVDTVLGYLRTGVKDMVERKNSHLQSTLFAGISERSSVWRKGGILQADHLQKLSPVFKKALYTHPRVHSLWDLLVARLGKETAEKPSTKKKKSKQQSSQPSGLLVQFWEEIMDRKYSLWILN